MKTSIKTKTNIFTAAAAVVVYSHASAWWWLDKVSNDVIWTKDNLDVAAQQLVSRGMGFLWLLAVLYMIYGGFIVLNASWDESKVKKWKTILFQSMLWLVIIFLSYSIVSWLLSSIFWWSQGG